MQMYTVHVLLHCRLPLESHEQIRTGSEEMSDMFLLMFKLHFVFFAQDPSKEAP